MNAGRLSLKGELQEPERRRAPQGAQGTKEALVPPNGVVRRMEAETSDSGVAGGEKPRESDNLVRLARNVIAIMPKAIIDALADEFVEEVQLNTDGTLWIVDRHGNQPAGRLGANEARGLIGSIVQLGTRQEVSDRNPHVEMMIPVVESIPLPGAGCRFTATVYPLARRPMFSFRRPQRFVLSLTDYVESGLLRNDEYAAIVHRIRDRKNFLIAGPTRSGKTTFAKALLREIAEQVGDERILILEDTPELDCPARNCSALQTDPNSGKDMHFLLKASLRYSPQRIVIGEVRDNAAAAVLDAWKTGHGGGLLTMHAGSALEALHRLREMAQGSNAQPPDRKVFADTIDTIITIDFANNRRRIREIKRLIECNDNDFILRPLVGSF